MNKPKHLKSIEQPMDFRSSLQQSCGTNMMSDKGKRTTFQFSLFHKVDPVIAHEQKL